MRKFRGSHAYELARKSVARIRRKDARLKRLQDGVSASLVSPPSTLTATVDGGDTPRARAPVRPVHDYTRECEAYRLRKPDLLRDAPGKWVVFVGKEMLGPFDDYPTTRREGHKHFGYGALYIKEVLDEEPIEMTGAVEISCQS